MVHRINWDCGIEEEYSMIMNTTGCDRETAIKAQVETNGDMTKSIMWIIETREDNNHDSHN